MVERETRKNEEASPSDGMLWVCASDTTHPLTTLHQADGSQRVLKHKPMASPFHMGSHLRCIDYVIVPMGSSIPIGEHTRSLDVLYYLDQGRGNLHLGGKVHRVGASDLILAPRSSQALLQNDTRESLALLAIGITAPAEPLYDLQVIEQLPGCCHESEQMTARVGQHPVSLTVGQIPLGTCFAGAWGDLLLLKVPPDGCLASVEQEYDESLFVVRGQASIQLRLGTIDAPFHTYADPTAGLNLLIPAGVPRRITNVSTTEALWLLIVQIGHA